MTDTNPANHTASTEASAFFAAHVPSQTIQLDPVAPEILRLKATTPAPKHRVQLRRHSRAGSAAVALLLCAAATAGCSIGPLSNAPKDIVTPTEATQAVKDALAINQRRELPKRSNALGPQYEVGSALAVDAAQNSLADAQGAPQLKSMTSRDIRVFVPHQTQYPALFVAEFAFDSVAGDGTKSTGNEVYLFVRGASSGWHVAAFASALTAPAPKLAVGSDGYATSGTKAAEAAARTYADYLTRGSAGGDVSGAGFAPGPWTDQSIASNRKPVADTTPVYTFAVKDVAPGMPVVSFAMDGGASLVLTSMSMQVVSTYRAGVCYTVKQGNVPGLPSVGNYRQETEVGEAMLAVTVPKTGKGMGVIGDGAYETGTGVAC